MLYKFFYRLFSVLLFMASNVQKIKIDKSGICYVTGFRRYISILLDLIIIIIVLQFCNMIMSLLLNLNEIILEHHEAIFSEIESEIRSKSFKLVILNQMFQFFVLFSYILYMWVRFAATPGKLVFGLRVVDGQTFKKMSLKQAISRFFALMLSAMPLFLGFILSNFDKRCQALHDKISGTVVVANSSLFSVGGINRF
ncbi:MAG: RDD family protein [Wolbachia endosymbiont of Menacanthus eurysternus]|nr:MAG: RDD family protein [Wolbachia endosymbiont of Menacanthus eurysternus]